MYTNKPIFHIQLQIFLILRTMKLHLKLIEPKQIAIHLQECEQSNTPQNNNKYPKNVKGI